MESNINIVSNIYIRTNQALQTDVEFLKQVRGYKALSKIAPKGSANVDNLTELQRSELDNTTPCIAVNNLLQEQCFGRVNSSEGIVCGCRCENLNCSHYDGCMALANSKKIVRGIPVKPDTSDDTQSSAEPLTYEYLGLTEESIVNNEIFNEKQAPQEEIVYKTFEESNEDYTEIDDQKIIIESPFEEKILVNAGPGTGKTYTAIKRLEYVISKNWIKDYSNVAVLCYTKSAEKVIKTRINEQVIAGRLPIEVNQIYICTVDSFATSYLRYIGDKDFQKMDYEQRIEHFNSTCKKKELDVFEYVIVDELQDFVNHRALMISTIIDAISCGCLLLGDKCQAIYDYSTKKGTNFSVTSVEFYNLVYNILPKDAKKYELTKNYRQENELSAISLKIRKALLKEDVQEVKQVIEKELAPFNLEPSTIAKFKPVIVKGRKTAILCRSNGEVELISCALHKAKIMHYTITSNKKHYFKSEIALILWDYCENEITKDKFIARYLDRICYNECDALMLFQMLQEFSQTNTTNQDFIKKDDLWHALQSDNEPPEKLISTIEDAVVVTTVHRAKGSEFDDVYLIKSNLSNKLEEARIMYVATTRAKENLKIVEITNIPFFKKANNRNYDTSKRYNEVDVVHISIYDDINPESMLFGNFYDVVALQQYLLDKVKINDKVDLILKGNNYMIYHVKGTIKNREQDVCIGVISNTAMRQLKNTINGLPPRISDVFISNIVTIPQNITSKTVPVQFKESKFSLGVQLSGYAKFDWSYGD